MIPLTDIEALIGPAAIAAAPGEGAHESPGMRQRNYRPATPLHLVAPGEKPTEGCGAWLRIGHEMPADLVACAAILNETLHRLDAQGLGAIAVERPPDSAEWAGGLDRLLQATEE